MLNRSSATDARRAQRADTHRSGCLRHPHPHAILYEVLLYLPTDQGCHCIKRRLRYVCTFWAALGQAPACLYVMMWGIGCEAQWLVEKLNAEHVLRNKREKTRLKFNRRRMLPIMSLWADLA